MYVQISFMQSLHLHTLFILYRATADMVHMTKMPFHKCKSTH